MYRPSVDSALCQWTLPFIRAARNKWMTAPSYLNETANGAGKAARLKNGLSGCKTEKRRNKKNNMVGQASRGCRREAVAGGLGRYHDEVLEMRARTAFQRENTTFCSFQMHRTHRIHFTRRRFILGVAGGLASGFLPLSQRSAFGKEQSVPPRIKAIAFDAFPIFDPRPVSVLAERLFPGKGTELSNQWRTRQFEYTSTARNFPWKNWGLLRIAWGIRSPRWFDSYREKPSNVSSLNAAHELSENYWVGGSSFMASCKRARIFSLASAGRVCDEVASSSVPNRLEAF